LQPLTLWVKSLQIAPAVVGRLNYKPVRNLVADLVAFASDLVEPYTREMMGNATTKSPNKMAKES